MSTAPDLHLSEHALALQWLDITVERFQANMRQLKIKDTGALLASFKKQVIGSADGRLQLQLSYALYGKFVDMGVGRGMGQGVRKADDGYDRIRTSRGRLKRHERKARKWYSKELAYQTKRLAELMSELHGTILISAVTDALPETTHINL
ncbi:hypothetical protein [Hymenobacter chitinivorans]|uniref:Uncharacterized protein n=1 Tax=Hymenobacter chitinivorans DSM 11115 TaxID=1121954 RepID=A0A2M9BNH8_9BACT|nr:hypothetical protein [Hymenobacter chitinivorans]PJJ59450.1 hypothetical protein CLV45_0867 [Hymenobacter chitinivorans DSM 11115]